MLTKEFVIEQIKAGNKKSECIDGRDFVRLCSFFRPRVRQHSTKVLIVGANPAARSRFHLAV